MTRAGRARWIAGAALLLTAATVGAEAQDPRMVEIVGLIRDGRQADAVGQYAKAYELAAGDQDEGAAALATRALRGLARASESRGDLAAAQGYHERLLQRDGTDAEARAKLAGLVRGRAKAP